MSGTLFHDHFKVVEYIPLCYTAKKKVTGEARLELARV